MTPGSHNEDIRPNLETLAALRRRREPTNQSEERMATPFANQRTGNVLGKITSARSETWELRRNIQQQLTSQHGTVSHCTGADMKQDCTIRYILLHPSLELAVMSFRDIYGTSELPLIKHV